jgi:c-di-GMP-binding flagellar brake protein YcgR
MDVDRKTEGMALLLEQRRAHSRQDVDVKAEISLVDQGCVLQCHVLDLSIGGCRLRTVQQLPANIQTRVEVTFKIRGLPLRLSGFTQWSGSGNQVGIRFADVPMRRREALSELLGEVEEENAAMAEAQAAEKAAAEIEAAEEFGATSQSQGQYGSSRSLPSKRERRTQLRQEVDTSAVIYLINLHSKLSGRILDLSLNGCRIRTDELFPVSIYTRVETEFRIEGLPFRLGGVTQAIHDRRHIGIRFLDMSSRKREQVEQLMAEIQERCSRE